MRRDGTIPNALWSRQPNLNPVVVEFPAAIPRLTLFRPTHPRRRHEFVACSGVTFAPRNPPPVPTSDLATFISATPEPVVSGQNVTYTVRVTNLGPSEAEDLVMTDPLPAGTTFVSCTTSHFVFGTCTGPAVGTNGTVTGRIGNLQPAPFEPGITFTIVARVNAAPGTAVQNTASASSFRSDPNTSNNSASVTTNVVAESFFNGVRAIAAGRSHTSSVRNDGTVWNWGTGSNGQLGNGNSGIGVRAVTPVQVNILENCTTWRMVMALCWPEVGATVWGWGTNPAGQLGDGTPLNALVRSRQLVSAT